MSNARFWAFINDGPVKLTLRPGQTLTHHEGGPTEEGWSYESTIWEHAGNHVIREWHSEGSGCDGRVGNHGTDACQLDQLSSGNEPLYLDGEAEVWDGVVWPAWDSVSRSQYDQYAESMGY